ncbi:ribosome recycling factor family protein [Pseudoalteromonas denitrificans]|uniref:Ribosome recycling factor n=1 Tax=Pseudoalteromonas denitrificans DSM 6059 TaxID=1123010 RepID=A0A1I1S437_9GAMM|nr:ribosome recycling factor family protein [Pseudoalteromonas denitrificans]SFD41137.1 Ribosome recycling factor [Pseudoalteromonas denitrificans DSM 6059]
MIEIPLNSFVRRTKNHKTLKLIIQNSGAVIKRKGRSRNWLLHADWAHICEIINKVQLSEEPSWQWFVNELQKYKPELSINDLVEIITKSPFISVNQLMAQTDCTLAQARQALDIAQWQ